jgi:hypothetical protein
MAQVEIQGLDKLKRALTGLPRELRAPVLREIAKKPAAKAASIARRMFPYGDTGATVKTIGVLKVKHPDQTYVSVGFRGRSLGYIYISAPTITRHKRGTIKGTPWLFDRAGEAMRATGMREMKIDLSRAMARYLRRFGYTVR